MRKNQSYLPKKVYLCTRIKNVEKQLIKFKTYVTDKENQKSSSECLPQGRT